MRQGKPVHRPSRLRRALSLALVTLAKLTSFIVLAVFVPVNLSLIRIKRRCVPALGARTHPVWIRDGGLLLSLLLPGFQVLGSLR